MPSSAGDRRLATFLFLDVVGSTSLAAELGDRRWRDLLQRFRRLVQRQVKAHGGVEQDWAGDGLFATFPDPAKAVHAATAITDAVHEIGIDVRCGIHTGEAEVVDGKLAGLGVHLAARVMGLGGAADVLVSGTVRDVMTGSSVTFEHRGTHELKGVPEERAIFRVTRIDDHPVAEPLAPEVVAARVAALEPLVLGRRRAVALVVGGGVGMIAILVVVLALMQTNGEGTTGARAGNGDPGPVTLVALDATDGSVIATLHDDAYGEHLWRTLSIEDGSLWQATEDRLVRRDPVTGAILGEVRLPPTWSSRGGALDGAFGFVWAAEAYVPGVTRIHRISPLSGGEKVIELEIALADMQAGNGSIWLLSADGQLDELDPISMKIVNTYETDTFTPGEVVPVAGYVWICDCQAGRVVQYDPRRQEVVDELELPQEGFLLGVSTTTGDEERVWLLDALHNTLTPIDPETGEADAPLGIGGAQITDATIDGDTLWVASQTQITRIDLAVNFQQHTFPVPEGVSAGSVVPTPDGDVIWVTNCGCPIQT